MPVLLCALVASVGTLAFAERALSAGRRPQPARNAPVTARANASAAALTPISLVPLDSAFAHLPGLFFTSVNRGQTKEIKLYDRAGRVDEAQAQELDRLLADTRDPKAVAELSLDRRTLQLVVRAAYHFGVSAVRVVSAYRKPGRRREGLHASGKAIDFDFPGLSSRTLAAYLRTLPRVGVGIYTHPRTAYVHLDTREHSFHWLDASPPGRTYRELAIGSRLLPKLDATYSRAADWPEGLLPIDRSDLGSD